MTNVKVGITAIIISMCLLSCGNGKKKSSDTYRVKSGRPITTEEYSRSSLSDTYRDADGVIHSNSNIFAPRRGESRNDESYQKRMKTGEYKTPKNQYKRGYEEGYEDGYNNRENIFN